MSLLRVLSRDRIYRRSTLACLGGAAAGGALALVFPWAGLPLALVGFFTGWAFWAQGARADAIIEKIGNDPQDHLLRWRWDGGSETVLGLSGLYENEELCDFVNGYRVEGVRLAWEGDALELELYLASRTGRPMPIVRRVKVPAAHAATAEQAARRLGAYYECQIEIELG